MTLTDRAAAALDATHGKTMTAKTKATAAFRKQAKARGYQVPAWMTEADALKLEARAAAAWDAAEELDLAPLAWLEVVASELVEIA